MQIIDDKFQQTLGIIGGIAQYRLDVYIEKGRCLLDKILCNIDIGDICRFGNFPDWKFSIGITDYVITITPEVPDLFLKWRWKMNQNTQSGIRITGWLSGFIKSVCNGGF